MRNPAHSACSPTAFSSELGVLRYADPLTPLLPPFRTLTSFPSTCGTLTPNMAMSA